MINTHDSGDDEQGSRPVEEAGNADVVAKGEDIGAQYDESRNELVFLGCDSIENRCAGQGVK